MLVHTRGVKLFIEQPFNSMFFLVGCMKSTLDMISAQRMITWLGGFGHPSPKPLEIFYTFNVPLVRDMLVRTAKDAKRGDRSVTKLATFQKRRSKHVSKRAWSKTVHVTGRKAQLESSKAYPPAFCNACADLINAWR